MNKNSIHKHWGGSSGVGWGDWRRESRRAVCKQAWRASSKVGIETKAIMNSGVLDAFENTLLYFRTRWCENTMSSICYSASDLSSSTLGARPHEMRTFKIQTTLLRCKQAQLCTLKCGEAYSDSAGIVPNIQAFCKSEIIKTPPYSDL